MASQNPNSTGLNQTRVSMRTAVVLNYDLAMLRRPTRAQIMEYGSPTVLGNDSTCNKEALPGQWTLVEETNMESREPQKVWRDTTNKTTDHLAKLLKESLLEHPHPMLSEQARVNLDEMRMKEGINRKLYKS